MTVISLLSGRSDESEEERVPKVITHANCSSHYIYIILYIYHVSHIHTRSGARPVPIQHKVYVYYKELCENKHFLKRKQSTTMINLGCICVVGERP